MRRGAVLIVVAGFAALLAAAAIAFLARVREDVAETQGAVREAQARIMLMAACDYVLECARVGYDVAPASGAPHREAFGWLDVRATAPATPDDAIGPRDQARAALWSPSPVEDSDGDGAADRPAWPAVGSVARCPMHRLRRPPYAAAPIAVTNPIDGDPTSPAFGRPYLTNPDPLPAVAPTWPRAVDPALFTDYARGDTRPVDTTTRVAWFRCCRESAAVFVLTCGAGASEGFRDWNEVVGAHAQDEFAGDPAEFAAIVAAETRLWYRIEWSAAIGSPTDFHFADNEERDADLYLLHPHNATQCCRGRSIRSQIRRPNCCGTLRWVQRLDGPPAMW